MATVVVFGGTGFLGRRLVEHLTTEGATVRVAVRQPDQARSIFRAAGLHDVAIVGADVRDKGSVTAALAVADAVVNAVSAYVEKAGVTFEAVHVHGAETVARESVAGGIARLVHVSGIGADPDSGSPYIRARGRGELMVQHADPDSGSPYIRARGRGELMVQQAYPGATIMRPGAMFGRGDALCSARLPIWPGYSR